MAKLVVAFVASALLVALVSARDASPINDFCVADLTSELHINGLACKSYGNTTGADFAYMGFREHADTNNSLGIGVLDAWADLNYPALNTQGFSLAKVYYDVEGLVPPHAHMRAAEVLTVLQGEVYAAFIDQWDHLFGASLKKGDIFVFPQGLIHFHYNVGPGHAQSLSVLNAQNPGVQVVPTAVFGSSPPIDTKILSKTFEIDDNFTRILQKNFEHGHH